MHGTYTLLKPAYWYYFLPDAVVVSIAVVAVVEVPKAIPCVVVPITVDMKY